VIPNNVVLARAKALEDWENGIETVCTFIDQVPELDYEIHVLPVNLLDQNS
jgi:hypothetical protein